MESPSEYLELTDWRRQLAAMWQEWRRSSPVDAAAAGTAFRDSKDRLFREHPQSPIPARDRASFASLAYWPHDPAYRMAVRIQALDGDAEPHASDASPSVPATASTPTSPARVAVAAPVDLPSSGSGSIPFRRIGRVHLTGPLDGRSLDVFWIDAYGGGIFLPFRDATSGSETYGAGRYLLDTIKSADHGGDPERGELTLDFNQAFHPSCAYDPAWSCPLAPPENRLTVPVRVGERLP